MCVCVYVHVCVCFVRLQLCNMIPGVVLPLPGSAMNRTCESVGVVVGVPNSIKIHSSWYYIQLLYRKQPSKALERVALEEVC